MKSKIRAIHRAAVSLVVLFTLTPIVPAVESRIDRLLAECETGPEVTVGRCQIDHRAFLLFESKTPSPLLTGKPPVVGIVDGDVEGGRVAGAGRNQQYSDHCDTQAVRMVAPQLRTGGGIRRPELVPDTCAGNGSTGRRDRATR